MPRPLQRISVAPDSHDAAGTACVLQPSLGNSAINLVMFSAVDEVRTVSSVKSLHKERSKECGSGCQLM